MRYPHAVARLQRMLATAVALPSVPFHGQRSAATTGVLQMHQPLIRTQLPAPANRDTAQRPRWGEHGHSEEKQR